MKYPFIIVFAMLVLASLFLIFLTCAVWDELRLFVGGRKEGWRFLE